jgi:S1-C subfamily serine protease
VIFIDGSADIALIRVPTVPEGIEPARLGDSDAVRKGQTVYIIGNPVGVEFSLSTGIVSGRHAMTHVFGGDGELELIQTDAAMNAGNSGGPMFNSRGEVIAIAQRILTSSGGSEGLGFGVAINAVRKVLTGDPCLWLGFSAIPLDAEWAAALNAPERDALLIQTVSPGSPAAKAGLRGGEVPVQTGEAHFLLGGDVILKVDGTPLGEWKRTPWPDPAEGTKHQLVLTVLRSGRMFDLSVETIHRSSVVKVLSRPKEANHEKGKR